MSETYKDYKEGSFKEVEVLMECRPVPGINIVRLRHDLEIETYSTGTYGQDETAVSPDTVYDLASVSKLYTLAMTLQQVQNGNIDLNGNLSIYLDGDNFRRSTLTIRDLLSHRVNFGLYLSDYRSKFPSDFKNQLLGVDIPHSASDSINYHNLGYIYLGYVLEAVSGKSLGSQMKKLFKDLGLLNTYTGEEIHNTAVRCPATEILEDGSVIANITHDESARLHGGLAGNAGVFASAMDLAQFGAAWLDGRIVSQEVLSDALTNHDSSGNNPQALGWWMRLKNGSHLPDGVYGHGGYTGCYLAIDTNNSEVTAITSNRTFLGRDNEAYQDIWAAALGMTK